jgi:predicted MFS family arabinose efflux permease
MTSAYRRYVLGCITVLALMHSVDKIVITIFQEHIKHDYGVSDTQLGLLTGTAYALVGALAALPLARLADRWPRHWIIGASFAVWTLMTSACGWATSWAGLFAARIGVGLGEAAFPAASFAMIGALYHDDDTGRTRAFGVSNAGTFIGMLIGLVAGGALVQQLGWQQGFVVLGLVGLVLAVIFLLTVREPARSRDEQPMSLRENWRTMFGEPGCFLLLIGAFTTAQTAGGALLSWMPSYLARGFGLTPLQIGLGLGLCLGLATTIGSVLGGMLGKRAEGKPLSWGAGFAARVAWIVLPIYLACFWAPHPLLCLGLLFAAFLIAGTMLAPVYSVVHQLVAPGARATALAVLGLAGALIGGGLGPVLVGAISDALHTNDGGAQGLRIAMTVVALVYVFTGSLFSLLAKRMDRQPPAFTSRVVPA